MTAVPAAAAPTELTLRVARDAAARQAALDAWLAATAGRRRAAIVESALAPLAAPADVPVTRLGAGCVCCVGLLPLRVALLRQLRARPQALLLIVADAAHLARLRAQIAAGEFGPLALAADPAGC